MGGVDCRAGQVAVELVVFTLRSCCCSERVSTIAADIALVQFGLSEEHYHFLSYEIDLVIHAAAYVNLIYPYKVNYSLELKAINFNCVGTPWHQCTWHS